MATTSITVLQTECAKPARSVSVLAWGGAAALAVVFATLSLLRHERLLTTGYDLGIFEQGVRSYAEGRLPTSLLKGVDYSLFGDHFSPIVGLLGPIYALVPRAEVLLVAQALLLAVGAVPLVYWAGRALGVWAATTIMLCYGLAGGLAHAAGFDFHEIAFAVPLLAFSLSALGQRRLRAAAAWAMPLIFVKEDLGITVASIGALIILLASSRSERYLGILAGAFGIVATTIETLILIPAANPTGANQYTHQLGFDTALTQATTFFSNDLKITTLALLLLPTAFIALRSPLVLAAVPTLAWRFLSDNPHYWGNAFHYDAVLVPIVTAAFVDGLVRMRRNREGLLRRQWGALLISLAATTALLSVSPLARLLTPTLWTSTTHEQIVHDALARIPDHATVAASNSLAPQLTARTEVSLIGIVPLAVAAPRFIVADTSIPHQYPMDADDLLTFTSEAEQDGYAILTSHDGVILLEKRTQ